MKVTINTKLKPMHFITDEEFTNAFQDCFEECSSESTKEEIKSYLKETFERNNTVLSTMRNAHIESYLLRRVLYSNCSIINWIKRMTETGSNYYMSYNFDERLKSKLRKIAYERIETNVSINVAPTKYITDPTDWAYRFEREMISSIYSRKVRPIIEQNIEHCIYEVLRPITNEVLRECLSK